LFLTMLTFPSVPIWRPPQTSKFLIVPSSHFDPPPLDALFPRNTPLPPGANSCRSTPSAAFGPFFVPSGKHPLATKKFVSAGDFIGKGPSLPLTLPPGCWWFLGTFRLLLELLPLMPTSLDTPLYFFPTSCLYGVLFFFSLEFFPWEPFFPKQYSPGFP